MWINGFMFIPIVGGIFMLMMAIRKFCWKENLGKFVSNSIEIIAFGISFGLAFEIFAKVNVHASAADYGPYTICGIFLLFASLIGVGKVFKETNFFSPQIHIVRAKYGVPGQLIPMDAKDVVYRLLREKTKNVLVGNRLFEEHDPVQMTAKTLEVTFIIKGVQNTKTFAEETVFELP